MKLYIEKVTIASIDSQNLPERLEYFIRVHIQPTYLDNYMDEHLYSLDDYDLDEDGTAMYGEIEEDLMELTRRTQKYSYIRITYLRPLTDAEKEAAK